VCAVYGDVAEFGQQLCMEHFFSSRCNVSEHASQQILSAACYEGDFSFHLHCE